MAAVLAARETCDFIALSEPNRAKCKTINRNTYTNENHSVAIINSSQNHAVINYRTGECFVCVYTASFIIYSVYISPNCPLEEYLSQLTGLQQDLQLAKSARKEIIVTGDFNAKNSFWGGCVTDRRGEILHEMALSMDLTFLNDGETPTLVRHNGVSFIDVTMVSEEVLRRNPSWSVLIEEPSMSDHNFVLLTVRGDLRNKTRYRFGCTNLNRMVTIFGNECEGRDIDVQTCRELLKSAYNKSTPRVRCGTDYSMPYWWGEDIQESISETKRKRKHYQRCSNHEERERRRLIYKYTKKELKRKISKAKREKWRELCDRLEEDVFGDGYKIVKAQLRLPNPKTCLTTQERDTIFRKLFIEYEERIDNQNFKKRVNHTGKEFSKAEVAAACQAIKLGKAPGPDGLSPDAIKAVIMGNMQYFTLVFSHLIKTSTFPEVWKCAKLVLIPKPKKNRQELTKYRPICLIDVIAKVYERLINQRLVEEIDSGRGLHPNQYGFRKGRSTVDAVKQVMDIAKQARDRDQWNALILIDVRNAFNEASWSLIIKKLRERGVAGYLVAVIQEYLHNRTVQLEQKIKKKVGGGVPQGSVLGPTLWNILYDDIMTTTDWEGVKIICYADDLAVSITANNPEELIFLANETLKDIDRWMKENKLKVAPEKTEAIILNNRRKVENISFKLGGARVKPVQQVTYLGMVLDRGLKMGTHVKHVCEKGKKTLRALCGLLPNVRGPGPHRRRVLAMATQAAILYGAPAWALAMKTKRYRQMVGTAQRGIALRTASAYRTVSTDATLVVAGLVPLHLLAEERRRLYALGRTINVTDRREERLETYTTWQREWESATAGRWTYQLIPNVQKWVERRHGQVNFYLTQFLTGHGVFQEFLEKIGKATSRACMYCDGKKDDARHTIFECTRWHRERCEMETMAGGARLYAENIVEYMLERQKTWEAVCVFVTTIMRKKEADRFRMGRE